MHANALPACQAQANVWLSCLLQRGITVPMLYFPRICIKAQCWTQSVTPLCPWSGEAFLKLALSAGSVNVGPPQGTNAAVWGFQT